MTVYRLGSDIVFPPVEEAEDGLLAVGGDLRPARLLRAYAEGIFPWYSEGEPILWHSPDPRFVLTSDQFRMPRSLRRTVKSGRFELTMDEAFARVMEGCATVARAGHGGTWITEEMKIAYGELHRLGFAHSVEVWSQGELVGGLYGVSIGAAYFGESMFTSASDASKVGFVALVEQLDAWGLTLIDCQIYTEHLARFGARAWPRRVYLEALHQAVQSPTRQCRWQFDGVG